MLLKCQESCLLYMWRSVVVASLSRKTADEHTPKQQPTPKSCLLESGGDVTPGSGEYPTTKDEMQFQLSLQVICYVMKDIFLWSGCNTFKLRTRCILRCVIHKDGGFSESNLNVNVGQLMAFFFLIQFKTYGILFFFLNLIMLYDGRERKQHILDIYGSPADLNSKGFRSS